MDDQINRNGLGDSAITENVILIRPVQYYYKGINADELYEITRGIWKLADRREKADYAFTVIDYIVKAAYSIHTWHLALETPYFIRKDLEKLCDEELQNRYEFVGTIDPQMQDKYLGQNLSIYYSHGNANPVMYVNC